MIENPKLQKEVSRLESKAEHIIEKSKKEKIQLEKEFENKSGILNNEIEELQKKVSFLLNGINKKDALYKSLTNKTNENISKITSLYSDLLLVQYSISEKYLINKSHPAIEEAKRIKELKKETKIHIERYRQMVYIYESLLQLFPELTNYVDDFETIQMLENSKSLEIFIENFDKVQYYISKEEYQRLNEQERNQMALDRYVKGQKSKWQIGRDYELFCGIEYEKENWNVEYIGIEKKLEDMGRDLIAIKGADIHVIQCKYWAQHKVIHEKHIAQLFGTTIAYKIEKG